MSAAAPLGFTHRWVPRAGATRTLLLLHGTGGTEDDLLPLGELLDPEAALLSPRGPVLEHGMPRFFRRLAEGVFDEADLRQRAGDLADFLRAAADAYGFDLGRTTAVGFSNGANIAAAVCLLHPGVLPEAILLRPMVPLVPDPLPVLPPTAALLLASAEDPIVPAANTERLAALLRDAGATVHLQWVPGGHQLTRADVTAARDWLSARDASRDAAANPGAR
ncbi:MAG: hypothetical protein RL139_1481 [Gemmatimonadota bacterium]|jgi:phospholipase/carboxylesterase